MKKNNNDHKCTTIFETDDVRYFKTSARLYRFLCCKCKEKLTESGICDYKKKD